MKKIILGLLLMLALVGCSNDSGTEMRVLQNKYRSAYIFKPPKTDSEYIVIKEKEVRFVMFFSSVGKITEKTICQDLLISSSNEVTN